LYIQNNPRIHGPKQKLDMFHDQVRHKKRKPKFALSGIKRELRAYKTPLIELKLLRE
jgi:hypothetical protein